MFDFRRVCCGPAFFLCALAFALSGSTKCWAQFETELVAEGLEHPWALAFLPESGYLVTERVGRLRKISPDGELSEPIAGLPDIFVKSQGGLMDLVLAPDFEQTRMIYFSYAVGTAEANTTELARATLDNESLRGFEVLFTAQPRRNRPVHYGGRILFLPDGSLLLTLGDGFDLREQAQNLGNHIGTIVRLLPNGDIPADNPFTDQPDALDAIYSYGHRNPQGIVVDPVNDIVWSHEHGPRGGDELNQIVAGENYGWPVATQGIDYSGALISPFENWSEARNPEWVWTPSIAPAGMALYLGTQFPEWNGDLLIASLAERSLRRVDLEADQVVGDSIVELDIDERLRDVRVGPDGGIYLLIDSAEGQIRRLRARP